MVNIKQVNFRGTAEDQVKQMYDLVVSLVNDHNNLESNHNQTKAELKRANVVINKLKGEVGV